jgi:hypothetical protein
LRAPGQPLRSAPPFTANTLFEWAQQNYPQFFAGAGVDGFEDPFTYRFYAQTSTYLAVSADGGVYVKGPEISGNQVAFIAPLSLLTCVVSPSTCPAIAVGGSGTGTVQASGDRDWHTVSLTAGQAYSMALEGADTGQGTLSDPLLRLFNAAGQELTFDDDSGKVFNSTIVCAPSASGVYYLAAEGVAGETGTYRLSVTPMAGGAVACENRAGENTGTNWDSPVSAPEILQGTVTLGGQQRVGAEFQIAGADTALEAIFVSQGVADLYVVNSADLPACLAGDSFNFIAAASFAGQSGFRSFTLAPGSYAICARNQTTLANTMRLELQRQTAAPGFEFSRNNFEPVARNIAPGGRFTQTASAGDVFRTFIDGASTGGVFYIIPAEEAQAFLAGQPFNHYPDLTNPCARVAGGTAADTSAPELCELPGVAQYSIAYINDTGSTHTIAIVGRDYTPE